jgi:hypothetical protein
MVLALTALTATARADEECPPGSVHKTQDGFSWCEPTVCANDGQCMPSEVCRPVGLCMEIGTLGDAQAPDGGKRLVVTQRCAPDKTCPQKQTCSDMSRCVSKAAADRMGILTASSAAPASSSASGSDPKKSSCACDLATKTYGSNGSIVFGLAFGALALRRKRTR